jgi:hypothetical protein
MQAFGYRMTWLFRLPPRMKSSHSTMNYRKVMTKLNENNVTYVIQTMASMNYFDSSRKNITYILNGSKDLNSRKDTNLVFSRFISPG